MKLNKKNENSMKTKNFMGETAYTLYDKERLVNLTATCLWGEPEYYGSVDSQIVELANKVEPEFVLKLARYLRNELNVRTVPQVLAIIVANRVDAKGTGLIRKYVPYIAKRADEINELMAAQLELFGKPIPNGLKKGLAKAMYNFDEYQFAKYKGKGKKVVHRDVLRLVRPNVENPIFGKIIKGTLKIPKTWETQTSKRGNTEVVWEELIDERKLGYMGTLRNLSNMLKTGISGDHIDKVCAYLTNINAVKGSRQFPFRFLSAYEKVEEHRKVGSFESESRNVEKLLDAIDRAVIISANENIPRITGKSVILADNSGSARGDWGGKSQMSVKSVRTKADAGNMMALLAWYASEDALFGVFGDRLGLISLKRDAKLLDNFKAVDRLGLGIGQNTENGVFLMLEKMRKEKIFADRIIVCSDLQIGDGKNNAYGVHTYGSRGGATVPQLVARYRKEVNPNFMYYSVCFNGYGNDVIVGEKKALIQGWNEKVFRFIGAYEHNNSGQIDYIESNYGLPTLSQF